MMTEEEIFGKFVPRPTVTKITLQSSGVAPKRLNPHIDEVVEKGISRNIPVIDYATGQPVQVGTTDREYYTTVSSESRTTGLVQGTEDANRTRGNLKIVLNLNIKDKIRSGQNSWFANVDPLLKPINNEDFDLKNYVKIYAVQISNSTIRNDILSSEDPAAELKAIKNGEREEYGYELDSNNWKEIQLSDLKDPNDIEVTDQEVSSAIGGPSNMVGLYDIPYEITCTYPTKNPRYLCYFVWSELDLSTLADEFEFDLTELNNLNLFENMNFSSQISDYVVISSGRLNENPDINIQDFRAVERLNKLQLDFSIVQNMLKSNLQLASKMRTANLNLDPPHTYYSEMWLARDNTNSCRFTFAADMGAIMTANSPFGQLFVNENTKEECLENTEILSMKLHRVRLKGSPEIGSKPMYGPPIMGKRQPKLFNENNEYLASFPNNSLVSENEELIVFAKEVGGAFNSTPMDVAGSVIENITSLYEQVTKTGVRYFGGIDKSIKFKTDGYYQYKVELELKDGAITVLSRYLRELIGAKSNLSEYYEEASKLGTKGFINPYNNPHAYNPELPQSSWNVMHGGTRPGNFNVSANRFTKDFMRKMRRQYPNDKPWETSAATYVTIMKDLSQVDGNDANILEEALKNYMSPETGNIEGILMVFNLIDSLENILSQAIGRIVSPPAGSARMSQNQNPNLLLSGKTVVESNVRNKNNIKTVQVAHMFGNRFNASIPGDTGINVFPKGPDDTGNSLLKFTPQAFTLVGSNELQKFFDVNFLNDGNPELYLSIIPDQSARNFSIRDSISTYFTPSHIEDKTQSVTLVPFGNASNSDVSQMPSVDELGRVGISEDLTLEQKNDAKMSLSQKLASLINNEYDVAVFKTGTEKLFRATSFEKAIGPNESRYTSGDYIDQNGYNETYENLKNDSKNTYNDAYNLMSSIISNIKNDPLSELNLYRSGNDSYLQQISFDPVKIRALPNPVKVLLYALNEGDRATGTTQEGTPTGQKLSRYIRPIIQQGGFDGDDVVLAAMKYLFQTIYKIEVFVGWQDNKMIPVWQELTTDYYNNAQGELACRFRLYENPELGLTYANASSLPLFNEYFILKAGT